MAGAFGSKPVAESLAAASGRVMEGEAVSDLTVVSAGGGVGLVLAPQPGFPKIRIKAKTWMPTTMPNIFRIFIDVSVGWLVGLKLSQILGGAEFADEAFKLVAAILVVAELVEARKAGAEQHVVARHRQLRGAAHGLVERGAGRMGHPEGRAMEGQPAARLAQHHRIVRKSAV